MRCLRLRSPGASGSSSVPGCCGGPGGGSSAFGPRFPGALARASWLVQPLWWLRALWGPPLFEFPGGGVSFARRPPPAPRPGGAGRPLAAVAASGFGAPPAVLCVRVGGPAGGGCSSPGAPWGAGGARLRCCAPWPWFLAWLLVPRPPPVAPVSSACLAWAASWAWGSPRRPPPGGPAGASREPGALRAGFALGPAFAGPLSRRRPAP